MPSKLRRAIGAVKDQTSIGLAKVTRSSNLEVAVLKATSHDEVPIEPCHLNDVLLLAASSPAAAAALVHALSRRMARTSNWVVALKSLILTFRALRDGGPHFSLEALATGRGRRGPRLLDLSSFCDDSSRSSPWDFTAFVRTFALYLDARLESFALGKLHHHHRRHPDQSGSRISNMKPAMVLDRIGHWQLLLDRAMGTRPTGTAKHNHLIQISLYSVVRESFDLYRDVSDGLSMLLDNFFHLQHSACIETFQACTRASKQFDELDSFHGFCKKMGVGRTSEYPSVQKISKQLLETLEEFFKDGKVSSTSPAAGLQNPPKLLPWSPTRRHSEDHSTSEASRYGQSWDGESAMSDKNWVPGGQAFPASSSNSNDVENGEEHRESGFDGWELVLVRTARASKSSEGLNPSPSEASLDRPLSLRFAENYSNPFLHDENHKRGFDVFPSPPPRTPLPTFRRAKRNNQRTPPPTVRAAEQPIEEWTPPPRFRAPAVRESKPNEERRLPPTSRSVNAKEERTPPSTFRAAAKPEKSMPRERDPFAAPQDGDLFESPLHAQTKQPSSIPASDDPARRQILLREQQMWMQQQSKIIAKNGLMS